MCLSIHVCNNQEACGFRTQKQAALSSAISTYYNRFREKMSETTSLKKGSIVILARLNKCFLIFRNWNKQRLRYEEVIRVDSRVRLSREEDMAKIKRMNRILKIFFLIFVGRVNSQGKNSILFFLIGKKIVGKDLNRSKSLFNSFPGTLL